MRRAVFLDRDGVINRAIIRGGRPYPPATLAELEVLPGVPAALQSWHNAGFILIVVTNQPDVEKGTQARAVVEAMHEYLRQALPLDDIRVCWDRTSTCYKPQPGMLLAAARDWKLDLRASFMVGDRWRDIGAGRAVGCYTILLGDGHGEAIDPPPQARCVDIAECAARILEISSHGRAQTAGEDHARTTKN